MASFRKLADKPAPAESPVVAKDRELRDVKKFLKMQKEHEDSEGDTEQAKKLKDFEKRNKQLSDDFKGMPKRGR